MKPKWTATTDEYHHFYVSMIGGTLSVVFFIYFIVDAGDA